MLFLTYHIVSEPKADASGLFTVRPAVLREHLSRVLGAGFKPANASDLAIGRADAKSCFFTFDDGSIDHYETVAPTLETHGLRGIFFVPTEKIGGKGRLERSHIAELHKRGNEIGCHSHEHRRLDALSNSAIDDQLARSCGMLGEITGHHPVILAPPGGYTNGKVRAACARAGMQALRTMKWGLNEKPNLSDLETIALYRDFPMARFEKILNGKGLRRLRALYFGKQMLKALLPISLYERTRNLVFRK